MIKSMTGYGQREASWSGASVVVEIRSVNHRFCELVARLPKALSPFEEDFKRAIQRRCVRGRIELSVSLTGKLESRRALALDRPAAQQCLRLLRELQRELRLGGTIDVALLASFREIITVTEAPLEDRRLRGLVGRLLNGALADLEAMRRREGTLLARDIRGRLRLVRDEAFRIRTRAPLVAQEHFDRMKARVEKLAGSAELDRTRLTQELALYADRCDVTEELTRLESHLAQFEETVKSRDSVGRTLDFLLQEMGREVNTIGAKANDAEIAGHIVRIKGELEKIREQVQNIE